MGQCAAALNCPYLPIPLGNNPKVAAGLIFYALLSWPSVFIFNGLSHQGASLPAFFVLLGHE